jgi:hypothetical protein
MATSSLHLIDGVPAMPQPNDLSRSLVALDQNSTIIAVIEMSQSSWLVGGMLTGIERQPQSQRDKEAAKWFRKLLKKLGRAPCVLVTEKLKELRRGQARDRARGRASAAQGPQ